MASAHLPFHGRVLLAALALLACGREPRPAPTLNVLLVSIDTLRADHLGCYGYERDTSPRLDAFAADAVRYGSAFAPAPWTLPSHAAMLTGRHPYELGLHDKDAALPPDVPLLAELLAAAGYATAAFVDSTPGGFLGGRRGFARGFQRFDHAPHVTDSQDTYDVAATVDAGLAWLDARDASRPFLLFLHTKSVHATPVDAPRAQTTDAPYAKPEPFQTRFLPAGGQRFRWHDGPAQGARYLRLLDESIGTGRLDPEQLPPGRRTELVAFYDGGIAYTDTHLGRLVDGLRDRDLLARTLVIVTSDHGEGLLEHRFFEHRELHAALLHVPLIVRDPAGPRGSVVDARVELMDIVPSVLERVGAPVPPEISGLALPDPGDERRPRPFYSYFVFDPGFYYEAFGVHDGGDKLLYERCGTGTDFRTLAYHTGSDPREHEPRNEQGGRQAELLSLLLRWKDAGAGAAAPAALLDDADRDDLRALGYLK